jgi:negative elongation factor E
MVYIHIPEQLTEEEHLLIAKYAKLKKKKKQVQALKVKPEVEKPTTLLKLKRPQDAKEVARKLVKSGNINIPKTEAQSDVKFKRPNISQERKKVQSIEATSYHPFSASSEEEKVRTPTTPVPEKPETETRPVSFLYQQIAETDSKKPNSQQRDKKSGYTVYVSGKGIDEEFLKRNFNEFGTIVNVAMEIEKGRGFITFSKTEATDRAIAEMNGKTINGIQLTVSLARKQPQIEPINDASSSAVWSTLATSQSQKGNYKDKRIPQVYDDLEIFN